MCHRLTNDQTDGLHIFDLSQHRKLTYQEEGSKKRGLLTGSKSGDTLVNCIIHAVFTGRSAEAGLELTL